MTIGEKATLMLKSFPDSGSDLMAGINNIKVFKIVFSNDKEKLKKYFEKLNEKHKDDIDKFYAGGKLNRPYIRFNNGEEILGLPISMSSRGYRCSHIVLDLESDYGENMELFTQVILPISYAVDKTRVEFM